jgi:thioredoxin-dependent peroxiredoxin
MLQVGEPIPDFDLASDTKGEVKSDALRGKRFVLYFYPKDDTSGCTMEACSFRDNLPDFSSLDVPVYGISPNDIASHEKFRTKYDLTFPLLADTEHKIAEAFGVWVEKNFAGNKYMGIQRSTFVIGPEGRIEHVWGKVSPAEHAREVLSYLRGGAVEHTMQQAEPLPVVEQALAAPEPNPAETPAGTPAPKPTPQKTSSRKAALKKTTAKKTARKVAAKKTAAKKTASVKSVAKKGAATKSTARKAATKKTAAKKSAAKKAAKKTARKTSSRS